MTFLNELWNKFKSTSSLSEQNEASEKASHPSIEPTQQLQNAEAVLSAFEENEGEHLKKEAVLENLRALKEVISQPKEEKPELRFTQIKQHLGDPECHETVRQERWHDNIYCPNCRSNRLKRLAQIPPQSPLNHRYRCLECGTVFNDDSDTPLERGLPPLSVWMHCWYLMGCTDSLSYIASKLNLDLSTVEHMARQLQKTFQAKQPLTRFVGFADWNKQADHLRVQLKEDLLKQYERLNANVATSPKDTIEFRRQQLLRRELSTTPKPTPPGTGKRR